MIGPAYADCLMMYCRVERSGRTHMPVENSRLSGFFRHSVSERREIVAQMANLSDEQIEALEACGALSEECRPND